MNPPFWRTLERWRDHRRLDRVLRSRGWHLSPRRLSMVEAEHQSWLRQYFPVDVKGLTVLDVGAGEGETALFYLAHGARHVICVEASEDAWLNLKLNEHNHPSKLTAVLEPFNLKMLDEYKFDFAKFDIEGYEEPLLDVDLKVPVVAEIHGNQLREKFREKGWRIPKRCRFVDDYSCTTYGYWMC